MFIDLQPPADDMRFILHELDSMPRRIDPLFIHIIQKTSQTFADHPLTHELQIFPGRLRTIYIGRAGSIHEDVSIG